jgi:hypothetical protein
VKKPVLVVMAAGMGSRYGGLKQMDAVGSCGEAILDYSLYDAYQAGFEKAVIIIKEAICTDFMEVVGKRLEKCPMEIAYAYQELHKLPAGYAIPAGREKPWGTCHAVLCAQDEIGGAPFAVINADDYYGKDAFRVMYSYLSALSDTEVGKYCMIGYTLGNTVTEHGSVTRGVCQVSKDDYLTDIAERTCVEKYAGGVRFTADDGATWENLNLDTIVSMNMWGFTADFLEAIAAGFPEFLETKVPNNPLKAEYLLPLMVGRYIQMCKATVKVLYCTDKWYGVTYAADKPIIVAALKSLTEEGEYPDGLWK